MAFLSAVLAAPAFASTPLPARFVADRVIVDVPLAGGGTLSFWTDTGGGGTILARRVVDAHGWKTRPAPAEAADELGRGARMLDQPIPFVPGALPVMPPTPVAVPLSLAPPGWDVPADGLLGNDWWAGHIWTWDYAKGTLALEEPDWAPPAGARVVPVGFRAVAHGNHMRPFPRIEVTIAGEPVSVLLDTGATTYLSSGAQRVIGGPRLRATSMMSATRFERWHRAHPGWRFVAKGQAGFGSEMIEVPDVRIAGYKVGPVWFTERADANFRDAMSSETDKPVEGAIGGNAFHTLRMTVDYVRGRVAFAQPRPR